MKYTRNLPLKLRQNGYEFLSKSDDDAIDYEVYTKGVIDVTVDHTNKEVVVNIGSVDEINVPTLQKLDELDKMLNE